MKILFHLNTLEQGGIERVVSNLANQFVEQGFVVFVTTQWYGEAEFSLDPRVKRVHVGLKEDDENKSRLIKFSFRVKYLRNLVKKEKPDIILAFDRKANYRALLATRIKVTPVIISIRNNPQDFYGGLIHKIFVNLLFPRAAGCVFQTEEQREFFPKKIREKSRIILNPLNDKYIGGTPPIERRKEIVMTSRLDITKNHEGAVRAFIRLHPDYPDYILKIYSADSGDGTKQKIEQIITTNRAENYIYLMGSSDSLEKELNVAAIFILNSHHEGLPNSLMEAMALGLPVIATDCPCGGPAALISDGINGLLIPAGDEEALIKAIRKLLNNPDYAETLGQAARMISKRCVLSEISAQWLDYIKECSSKEK